MRQRIPDEQPEPIADRDLALILRALLILLSEANHPPAEFFRALQDRIEELKP